MNDRWLPVAGYEGLYEVSSLGALRSLDRVDSDGNRRKGRPMKITQLPRGYQCISLTRENKRKTKLVHRLVALAFLPNPDGLPQVNHKDGQPWNNQIGNLEWATSKENLIHSSRVLLRKVRPVFGLRVSDGTRIDFDSMQLASEAGFKRANIQACISGKRAQHAGYRWFDGTTKGLT